MQKLEIEESVTKTIIAEILWNKTGLELEKGMRYDISVLPPDQIWTDGKVFVKKSTAEGFSNIILDLFKSKKRAKNEKWFALMGCINENGNTFFKIGTSCTNYSPTETGELICFANDAEDHYENNKGQMNLVIMRIA